MPMSGARSSDADAVSTAEEAPVSGEQQEDDDGGKRKRETPPRQVERDGCHPPALSNEAQQHEDAEERGQVGEEIARAKDDRTENVRSSTSTPPIP